MNNKTKTFIAIIAFGVFIFLAYQGYNLLANRYKPEIAQKATEEPTTEDTKTEEPKSEDTKIEDTKTDEPKSEDSTESQDKDLQKAPDFTVYDKDGNTVKLSDFKGKGVVLNFWASWCGPCKSEMPDFQEVYDSLSEEDNVVFMMVNLTQGRESESSAKQFLEQAGFEFPVYFDLDQNAASTYGIRYIPTSFFIDKEGNIQGSYQTIIDKTTLESNIDLIKEK